MKVPSCVLWQLTKKHSAYIVQPKGSKVSGSQFSSDPFNLTGLHNASSQGFTTDNAYGLQGVKGISKAKKTHRKVFVLLKRSKQSHASAKVSKNATGLKKNAYSV